VLSAVVEQKVVEHAGFLEDQHVHSFEQLAEPGVDSSAEDPIADQDTWDFGRVPSVPGAIGQVEVGLRIGSFNVI